jgi:hypothetical protein
MTQLQNTLCQRTADGTTASNAVASLYSALCTAYQPERHAAHRASRLGCATHPRYAVPSLRAGQTETSKGPLQHPVRNSLYTLPSSGLRKKHLLKKCTRLSENRWKKRNTRKDNMKMRCEGEGKGPKKHMVPESKIELELSAHLRSSLKCFLVLNSFRLICGPCNRLRCQTRPHETFAYSKEQNRSE